MTLNLDEDNIKDKNAAILRSNVGGEEGKEDKGTLPELAVHNERGVCLNDYKTLCWATNDQQHKTVHRTKATRNVRTTHRLTTPQCLRKRTRVNATTSQNPFHSRR